MLLKSHAHKSICIHTTKTCMYSLLTIVNQIRKGNCGYIIAYLLMSELTITTLYLYLECHLVHYKIRNIPDPIPQETFGEVDENRKMVQSLCFTLPVQHCRVVSTHPSFHSSSFSPKSHHPVVGLILLPCDICTLF